MRPVVTSLVCVLLMTTAAAGAASRPPALVRASSLSGLGIRHAVRATVESPSRFKADAVRMLDRSYAQSLQKLDDTFYVALGLEPASSTIRGSLLDTTSSARALYDPAARIVRVRRSPKAGRNDLVDAYVRALVDQNFGLRRLTTLRRRDRDAFLAASGFVDGIASRASGIVPKTRPSGSTMSRFLDAERASAVAAGRSLTANLRYLGGRFAIATALRRFPQTTEQLLHLDKFLQREPALPMPLPTTIANVHLSATETFGELDVRALLRAFAIPNANDVAAGWGGGRIAVYDDGAGGRTVGLALRWDSEEDAQQWTSIAQTLVTDAFPSAVTHGCPAVDHCWLTSDRELAVASNGTLTVLGSGPAGELVAASLLH